MIHVRDARPSDHGFIARAQVQMARETEGLELDPATVEAGVRGVLEHPDRGFYLVATIDDAPVATLLVLKEWSDWRNREVFWVHSVWVTPEHRQSGAFRALFAEVERRARHVGAGGIRLYVDHTNLRAQAVYRALGMTDEHYRLFEKMFATP